MDTHVDLQEKVNASIDIVAENNKKLEDFVSKLATEEKKSKDLEEQLGDYSKIVDEVESQSQQVLDPFVDELAQYGLSKERIAEMAAEIAKTIADKLRKKKK